jgi:O-acetyl-ADP-ribose deacetylase (regulator of RNase III)
MPICYETGDATKPEGEGHKVICHVCNDIGGWGAGFVVALSKRWKLPELKYRDWYAGRSDEGPFELGAVQFVPVTPDITVANLIGQHGIRRGKGGEPPVRYEAIRTALDRVADFCLANSATVHMPRIGAGLAGGDWATIEKIVEEALCKRSVEVTVWDLPPK